MPSNPKQTLNNLLSTLGAEIGVPTLALNTHNVCTFKYKTHLDFAIELPPEASDMYFYVSLLNLPQSNAEALYYSLLKSNFFNIETRGATLAIDERHKCIALCFIHSLENLDFTGFRNLVGNFLETAEKWFNILNKASLTETIGEASSKKTAESNPNSGFKV